MATQDAFEKFLAFMAGGGEGTKSEMAAWLDVSDSTLRSYVVRARQADLPVVWRLKGGKFVYFVADDYEAARPALNHYHRVAIGVMKAARRLIRGLLKKGQGPDATEVLEALEAKLDEAILVLAGMDA